MTGRRWRWLTGALGVGVTMLVGFVAGAVPAQAVGELSPTGQESFADLAACAASADTLLVSIVVDESGSLQKTDPENQRVQAVLTAVDALEQLGSSTDLTVEADLAVFGGTFSELVGWGPVEGDHAARLRQAATTQLPSRNDSRFTDYRAALTGARTSLDARAQATDADSCRLVLWLTDGKLDVDDTGGASAANDAARAEICTPGGIVDGVRADGVSVVALGLLTSQDADAALDRARLQAIAEGTADAETCGAQPVSGTNGAFLNAADAGALNSLFAQTIALLEGASGGLSVTCPGADCPEGRLAIPVDAGVGGIRLVIDTSAGAAPMELVSPQGESVTVNPSATTLAGANLGVIEGNSGRLVTLDVRGLRGASAATGTWTLVTDPATTTVIDRYYFWDVTLAVSAPDGVVLGEPSRLTVTALDAAGAPVDLSVLGSVQLEATINGTQQAFEPTGEGWTTEVTIPTTDAVSALAVVGRASAVTTPHSIALGPVSVQTSVPTQLPPDYPTMEPATLELGRLSGTTSATTTLTLSGAARGETHACFADGSVAAPEQAGAVTLTAGGTLVDDDGCVTVPAGGTLEVPVTLEAQHAADGIVSASLPVTLIGVDGDELRLDVPASGSMARPVDESTRWGLTALFAALAVAIAWGVAAGARRLLAQYRVSPFARYAEVPVRVGPDGPHRSDGSSPLVEAQQMRTLGRSGRTRDMTVGPARYGITYPVNPLADARAWVTGSGGLVPITDKRATVTDPRRRLVDLPGTAGFVIVTERPDSQVPQDSIRGTLVLVVDPGRTSRSHADLLPDRLRQLNEVRWSDEVARARLAWETLDRSARGDAPAQPDTATGPGDGFPPQRRPSAETAGTGSEAGPPPRRGDDSGAVRDATDSRGSETWPPPRRDAGRGSSPTSMPSPGPSSSPGDDVWPPPRR